MRGGGLHSKQGWAAVLPSSPRARHPPIAPPPSPPPSLSPRPPLPTHGPCTPTTLPPPTRRRRAAKCPATPSSHTPPSPTHQGGRHARVVCANRLELLVECVHICGRRRLGHLRLTPHHRRRSARSSAPLDGGWTSSQARRHAREAGGLHHGGRCCTVAGQSVRVCLGARCAMLGHCCWAWGSVCVRMGGRRGRVRSEGPQRAALWGCKPFYKAAGAASGSVGKCAEKRRGGYMARGYKGENSARDLTRRPPLRRRRLRRRPRPLLRAPFRAW